MAVQQNKKSVARRGNRRAHDFLKNPPTAVEATTGEVHRRHHISRRRILSRQEGHRDEAGRIILAEAAS